MRKIPTVFTRDFNARPAYVTEQVNPDCQWVLDGEGKATRKLDGVCTMLDDAGNWWVRREVKEGKQPPANYVPISTDEETGKTVGWEPIEQSGFAKWHAEALANHAATNNGIYEPRAGATYELIGPKVNGNPEREERHWLVEHSKATWMVVRDLTFDGIRAAVLHAAEVDGCEGIVWHHGDGIRFAKVKARDFKADPS
jgi:hypothetical protein